MSSDDVGHLDVLIFGGGAAGLWLLDELHRAGLRALLIECHALGTGQSIAAQGIIHGGLKYSLGGLLTGSANALREMPDLWRACLAGEREPNLSDTRVLAENCYLWRTSSLKSRMGMVGARSGLRSAVEKIERQDRPPALASCPGDVFLINEQVIDAPSFIGTLAPRHHERILYVDAGQGIEFDTPSAGVVDRVRLADIETGARFAVRPRHVVFTAGAGNEFLREQAGLPSSAMQRRPLHMVMVRGNLPVLYGHCVDGSKTRVTITTSFDSVGRRVWQVGGQVAENGVHMDQSELIAHARCELEAVLPDTDFSDTLWSTYRVDRAEGQTPSGARPDGPMLRVDGNVITGWPTKLALVPELAKLIKNLVGEPSAPESIGMAIPPDWPRPEVALPPWETTKDWVKAN